MNFLLRILLVAGVFSLAPLSSAHAQETEPAAVQGLNPGDVIRIVVWRREEFSGEFPISASGTIVHPLYRELQVTGVPLATVEERLRAFLTRYETNPQFVIQPLLRVIVGGEVRTPNILSVPPGTTLTQAIALAGGISERGNIRDVRVYRGGSEVKIDLSQPETNAGLIQIRSGDQIIVARRRTPVREIVAPVTSTIAAAAAIISIFVRY
jgi:protein involved in polysaccharide export with SLBB domain